MGLFFKLVHVDLQRIDSRINAISLNCIAHEMSTLNSEYLGMFAESSSQKIKTFIYLLSREGPNHEEKGLLRKTVITESSTCSRWGAPTRVIKRVIRMIRETFPRPLDCTHGTGEVHRQ